MTLPSLSRRTLLQAAAVPLALSSAHRALAQTEEPAWRHGVSLFGDVKYPPGFPRFDYVNAAAPKGGAVRMSAIGTFDNFNVIISDIKGALVDRLELIYDNLLVQALDEPSTEYGLIAEAVRFPADFAWAAFRLRPEAKWHDGQPITVEDVIFSFDVFKQYRPRESAYYRHVVKAEKTGEREVTFRFDSVGNRELPLILGQLTVLPKHWWEGTDASGRKRDVSATMLEIPLGSGAYRMKEFEAGRHVVYERVPDYWGRNLNVNIGRDNFAEIRYDYFRNTEVAIEAFKADRIDWRNENSAKEWATGYDFPAIRDRRVVKEEFPIRASGGMQSFAFNARRDKFKDLRVRFALSHTFDFEDINKTLFYSQYFRTSSYFEGTELAWNGKTDGSSAPPSSPLPQSLELEILETVRDQVPPEVFTQPYKNPVGGTPEAARNNLREAIRLFKEAGYELRDRRMVNAKTGEPFTVDFLLDQPAFERVALFMKPGLERLGIVTTVRTVDPSQHENRQRSWDFDIVVKTWGESLSPGNEQREYWGSQAADQPGSQNLVGIKNPAVDALVQRIIYAKDRAELVAATRALDRVLLWNHYVIPQWTYPKRRTARWDRFGRPATLPAYGEAAFPNVWWWDNTRLSGARAQP